MDSLELVPRSWFSWNFSVFQNNSPIADIDVSWWRERGVFTIGEARYDVYREGLMRGAFVLERNGTRLATAEKPSAVFRAFLLIFEGEAYTLKAASIFRRTFLLLRNEQQVGFIEPKSLFTRKATAALPDDLTLPVKVFLIWLAVLLWKRESSAAGATAATAGG